MDSSKFFFYFVIGLAIIAFIIFIISSKNVKKYKSSKEIPGNLMLTAFSYSISDEAEGYSYDLSVHIVNGVVTVVKTERMFKNANEQITSNGTSFDILYELEEIVEKNNLLSWSELPMNDVASSDPYQRSVYMYYDNVYYSFSTELRLPSSSKYIFDQIERTILKYLEK